MRSPENTTAQLQARHSLRRNRTKSSTVSSRRTSSSYSVIMTIQSWLQLNTPHPPTPLPHLPTSRPHPIYLSLPCTLRLCSSPYTFLPTYPSPLTPCTFLLIYPTPLALPSSQLHAHSSIPSLPISASPPCSLRLHKGHQVGRRRRLGSAQWRARCFSSGIFLLVLFVFVLLSLRNAMAKGGRRFLVNKMYLLSRRILRSEKKKTSRIIWMVS